MHVQRLTAKRKRRCAFHGIPVASSQRISVVESRRRMHACMTFEFRDDMRRSTSCWCRRLSTETQWCFLIIRPPPSIPSLFPILPASVPCCAPSYLFLSCLDRILCVYNVS
ncbi:hypothetical protein K439DRAFT_1087992 [Ramaria rubella]|nr:hypothetical protein K439DRAFT_1087992 [Ramaria rubella]